VQNRSAPFKLSRTNAALKLLQHARDEAHRFAQGYHHLLIARRQFQDLLNPKNTAKKRLPKPVSATPAADAAPPPSTPKADAAGFTVLSQEQLKAKLGQKKAAGKRRERKKQ
jgi:hypothetical protein